MSTNGGGGSKWPKIMSTLFVHSPRVVRFLEIKTPPLPLVVKPGHLANPPAPLVHVTTWTLSFRVPSPFP